jgi:hypothetical protein
MTKFCLLTIASSLFIFSCKTASKSFQKGDYTQAIELGVKKLQKNPGDYDTRDLVQRSYNYEVTQHEDEIRILSNSNSDLRYDKMISAYQHLQHLYDYIHQYPSVSEVIKTTDYSSYLETYKSKAAEVHMNRGNSMMQEGTKAAYRQAYHEFVTASNYLPDDLDIRRSRDEAYNAALINVIVVPMQPYSGYTYASFKAATLQNEIMRTLSYHLNNEFVRFYQEGEARSRGIQPDEILELSLQRISLGQPFDKVTTREVSKKVVTKETILKTDSVVREYATVKATINTTQRTVISEMDLFINIRNPRGELIWNDHFTAQHNWKVQFCTYTGDERALEDSDKALLQKNSANYTPPAEEKTMEDLVQQLQSDLTYHLRNYYNRYQ